MDILFLIIACIFFLVGVIGIVAPAIPSLPVVWAGVLFFALMTNFATVDVRVIVITGVIAAVGTLLDFAANAIGAKKFGATRWGIAGAIGGSIIGIAFGPLGIIAGAFLGALALEFAKDQQTTRALHAGVGTFIGFLFGTLAKIVLAFVMIGMFFAAVF